MNRPRLFPSFDDSSSLPRRRGLLLVGHGTRDEQGKKELFETATLVAQQTEGVAVAVGFLEMAEPNIEQAVRALWEAGVRRIMAVPLLLFSAGHAKRDIPEALTEVSRSLPDLEITLACHLGCHEFLVELSARRFFETVSGEEGFATDKSHPIFGGLRDRSATDLTIIERTFLLLVGRGSKDDSATAEMQEFLRQRQRKTPVARAEACFLAMARPSLEELLNVAAESAYEQVVVQPHLLFYGELLNRLTAQVAAVGKATHQPRISSKRWLIAKHLGPDPLVAQAVLDRAQAAVDSRKAKKPLPPVPDK